MTPQEFVEKWHKSALKERSASQSHFNDLCALLGEQNPTDADQAGEWFCFEKGAKKTNEGASVRVSLISFSAEKSGGASLDGESMAIIFSNLQGLRAGAEMTRNVDLTQTGPLKDNKGWSYFGLCLAGKFKVSSDIARQWLHLPNPHGKPNSDVLKSIYNGSDITQHWKGNWVIDFSPTMTEQEAALYEAPFAWVVEHVKPVRINNNRKARAVYWWRHGEGRPGLRAKLKVSISTCAASFG